MRKAFETKEQGNALKWRCDEFDFAPGHWLKQACPLTRNDLMVSLNGKKFTLINCILVYFLVKFQWCIFFSKGVSSKCINFRTALVCHVLRLLVHVGIRIAGNAEFIYICIICLMHTGIYPIWTNCNNEALSDFLKTLNKANKTGRGLNYCIHIRTIKEKT